MQVASAVALINESFIFMPGWTFQAEDYTARHEHAVKVTVAYDTYDFRKAEAPMYCTRIAPSADFVLDASRVNDLPDLVRQLIGLACKCFEHEAREAARVGPTWWGPFNPHMTEGQERWGDVTGDIAFGNV